MESQSDGTAASMLELVLKTYFFPTQDEQPINPDIAFEQYMKVLKWKQKQLLAELGKTGQSVQEVKALAGKHQRILNEYLRAGKTWASRPTHNSVKTFIQLRNKLIEALSLDNPFASPQLTAALKDDWYIARTQYSSEVLKASKDRQSLVGSEFEKLKEALQKIRESAALEVKAVSSHNQSQSQTAASSRQKNTDEYKQFQVARRYAHNLWERFSVRLNETHENNTFHMLDLILKQEPGVQHLLEQLWKEAELRNKTRSSSTDLFGEDTEAGGSLWGQGAGDLEDIEGEVEIGGADLDERWRDFPKVDEKGTQDLATKYAQAWQRLKDKMPVCKLLQPVRTEADPTMDPFSSSDSFADNPLESFEDDAGEESALGGQSAGYQLTVVDLASPFNKQSKGNLIFYPPGLGKTRTAMEVIDMFFKVDPSDHERAFTSPLVMVMVPNKDIQASWAAEFRKQDKVLGLIEVVDKKGSMLYLSSDKRCILLQIMHEPIHPHIVRLLDPESWKTVEAMASKLGAEDDSKWDKEERKAKYLLSLTYPPPYMQAKANPLRMQRAEDVERSGVFAIPWKGLIFVDEADKLVDPQHFSDNPNELVSVYHWLEVLQKSGPFCKIFLFTGTPLGSAKNYAALFRLLNLALYPGMPRIDPGYLRPANPQLSTEKPTSEIKEAKKGYQKRPQLGGAKKEGEMQDTEVLDPRQWPVRFDRIDQLNNEAILEFLRKNKALLSIAYSNVVLHVDIKNKPSVLASLSTLDSILEIKGKRETLSVWDPQWTFGAWDQVRTPGTDPYSSLLQLVKLYPFVPVVYPAGSTVERTHQQAADLWASLAVSILQLGSSKDMKWGFYKHVVMFRAKGRLTDFPGSKWWNSFNAKLERSHIKTRVFRDVDCIKALDKLDPDWFKRKGHEKSALIEEWLQKYWETNQPSYPNIIINLPIMQRAASTAREKNRNAAINDWVKTMTLMLWNSLEAAEETRSASFLFTTTKASVGVDIHNAEVIHMIAPPHLTQLEQATKRIQRLCSHASRRNLKLARLNAWEAAQKSTRSRTAAKIRQEIKENKIWAFVYFRKEGLGQEPLIKTLPKQKEQASLENWLKEISLDCELWKTVNNNGLSCFNTVAGNRALMSSDTAKAARVRSADTKSGKRKPVEVTHLVWGNPKVERFSIDTADFEIDIAPTRKPTLHVAWSLHTTFLFYLLQAMFPVLTDGRIQKSCWFLPTYANKIVPTETSTDEELRLITLKSYSEREGHQKSSEMFNYVAVNLDQLSKLAAETMRVDNALIPRIVRGKASSSQAATRVLPPELTVATAETVASADEPTREEITKRLEAKGQGAALEPTMGEFFRASDLSVFLKLRHADWKGDDGSWMIRLLTQPAMFTDLEIFSILCSLKNDQVAFLFAVVFSCQRNPDEYTLKQFRLVSFARISFLLDQLSLLLDLARLRKLRFFKNGAVGNEAKAEVDHAVQKAQQSNEENSGAFQQDGWGEHLKKVFKQLGNVVPDWKQDSEARKEMGEEKQKSRFHNPELDAFTTPPTVELPPAVLRLPLQSSWSKTAIQTAVNR